jgi:YbbR domain-containing protein
MVDRIWLKIFSVLLALSAWMYVNLVDPPQTRRNVELGIEYVNVPQNIWITPTKARATVRLEGSRRDFMYARTAKRYAQLKVDFKGVGNGSYQLPIEAANTFPGLTAISVAPEKLAVEVEKVVTRTIAVLPELTGRPAEGYLAAEPIITPTQVTIQGSEDAVTKILRGFVQLSLDGVRNSMSQSLDVQLLATESIDGCRILTEPSKVSVSLAVKQGYPTKVVRLTRPVFRGSLPEGRRLVSYTVSPEEVTISGPEKLLKIVDELSFRPINLGNVTASTLMPVSLELPSDKLELVEPKAIWLDMNIDETPVKREFLQIPIDMLYDGSKGVSLSETYCAYELEGMVESFEGLQVERLRPVITIPSNTAHRNLSIKLEPPALPSGVRVLKLMPEFVTVTIGDLDE